MTGKKDIANTRKKEKKNNLDRKYVQVYPGKLC